MQKRVELLPNVLQTFVLPLDYRINAPLRILTSTSKIKIHCAADYTNGEADGGN